MNRPQAAGGGEQSQLLPKRSYWFVAGAWWLLGEDEEPIAYGESPFPLRRPCLN